MSNVSINVMPAGRRKVSPFCRLQVPASMKYFTTAIRGHRNYLGDKWIRVAPPHKILDHKNGPLIAVRLHIISRKTLGGLQTDLSGRVLDSAGHAIPGLYAAGEVSGFGGGGVHGYRSIEGTFLGGCLFTGRTAGRAIMPGSKSR